MFMDYSDVSYATTYYKNSDKIVKLGCFSQIKDKDRMSKAKTKDRSFRKCTKSAKSLPRSFYQ